MTDEENAAVVAADVNLQLAPNWPPPKMYIAPRTVKHYVNMLERPSPVDVLDDYDRSIVQSTKANRLVGQLGEQNNQELPPLNVYSYDDPETAEQVERTARNFGTTVQYQGYYPTAELAYRYSYGKRLLRADQFAHLGTQMRRLQDGYMKACMEGEIMLIVAF
jgi:hypothetical protein